MTTRISDGSGHNSFPVLLASDNESYVDLCRLLKQHYKIVDIKLVETKTEIQLECLFVPTTEFIRNAFSDLLIIILTRDPLWRIFPLSSISSISITGDAVINNLGNSNTATFSLTRAEGSNELF